MIGHIGNTINPSAILSFFNLTFEVTDTRSPIEITDIRDRKIGYSITANSHDTINGKAGAHVSKIIIVPHVGWEYRCWSSQDGRELFNGSPL